MKKIIIIEFLIMLGLGYFIYSSYMEEKRKQLLLGTKNEEISSLNVKQDELNKEIENVTEEVTVLKDKYNDKQLDIWKRRIEQVKEKLEQ
ncbi:MAG: hypothetical protein IK151_02940 [Erysipelotrichaceae bacterium]|nr:hypothetical protein [Erysipelotrichaceae bacterium]